MEKTQEELQKIWDTCLLRYWRNAGNVIAAILDFQQQTGKSILECGLLRVPPPGYPWKMGMRVFIADRLQKIGDRMWDMPQERDGALIDKLQTSKYDTSKQSMNSDSELSRQKKKTKENRAKMALENKNYRNRNQKTDWKTVK